MADDDEIEQLRNEIRLLRMRAGQVIGAAAVAAHLLKQSMAERQRLKEWAAEAQGSLQETPVPLSAEHLAPHKERCQKRIRTVAGYNSGSGRE